MLKRLLLVLLLLARFNPLYGQSTAFTYQGRLEHNGSPFTGTAEFHATLWNAASGGVAVATNLPATVIASITDGQFTLPLDFGDRFPGDERWLQLEVRTTIGAFTTLSPRQRLTPTPYAIAAGRLNGPLPASQLNGTLAASQLPASVVTNQATGLNLAGTFSGNGTGLSNVDAASLNGITSAGFWRTNGNWNASPTNGAFLGTMDPQPFEIRVDSRRALRVEPNGDRPNLIGGHFRNAVSNGMYGATIVGGGSFEMPNRANDSFATVLGGEGNTAGGRASVAMGFNTAATASFATAAGADTIAGGNSAIAMGNTTTASGDYAVALGRENVASGFNATALGAGTTASGHAATALGSGSTASGERATALGFVSWASGGYSTAIGYGSVSSGFAATALGRQTLAAGDHSFAAGYQAKANHPGSFVWADGIGMDFSSSDANQFVIRASSGVGIGTGNPKADLHLYSFNNPTVMRIQSTGTPGFGRLEFVSNPQGDVNEWRPAFIQSTDVGGFTGGLAFYVNGSGADQKFATNEVMRLQNGRVGIGNNAPGTLLQVGNATCNGTTWANASDRNLKEAFESVDPQAVLARVTALPLTSWKYKADAPDERHLGPMAQDFHAAFGLGAKDTTIATVDADGVALAAIQGLNQKLEEKLAAQATEIAELKRALEKLSLVVDNLSSTQE